MIACVTSKDSGSPRSSYTFIEYTRDSVVVPRPTMTAVSMVDSRGVIDKTLTHSEQYRPAAPSSTIDWYVTKFPFLHKYINA